MPKQTRKLNRWPGYDYSWPGLYFVTFCTHRRSNHFGEVINNQMQLNDLGKIIKECWFDLPNHYPHCQLDEYIIMPNHVHGIIYISNVGTPPFAKGGVPTKHGLSEIIRALKTFSARKINQTNIITPFAWQRSFYDRVIRNEKELNNIRQYITDNPINWEFDRNNQQNYIVRTGLKPVTTE